MGLDIKGVKTFEYTKIIGIENIDFGSNIIIDDFTLIYAKGKISIANYVHIGAFSSVMAGEDITFGELSGLSHGVKIFTTSDDFVGTGFGNPTIDPKYRNLKSGPVEIERFAIIGTNAVILPGVTIGEGSSVAANSVITKDLEPWSIYVSNRKVGTRNKEEILTNYEKFLEENIND